MYEERESHVNISSVYPQGLLILYYRVGFNLHQPVRINEASHLHDGVGGSDISEELAVYLSNALPILYAGE